MIVGTGIDVCELNRLQTALQRHGDRFLQRVFTPAELLYCNRKRHTAVESLAARFAAKEAAGKALGTGMAAGIGWQDVEVTRLPDCRPALLLHARAAERAALLGVTTTHLSLSHGRAVAVASVVLEAAASDGALRLE